MRIWDSTPAANSKAALNQFRSHAPTDFNSFQYYTAKLNPFFHNFKKLPNILYKSCGVNTTRFLKNVWPFFNIMKERVNGNMGVMGEMGVTKSLNRKRNLFQSK